MVDLSTRYLGLTLPSPVAASASPLSDSIDTLKRLEAAGVGAVVLRSLFEEQIVHESLDLHELLEQWTESYLEAQSFFPALPEHSTRPAAYLEAIEQARRELSIPVIASLNGITPGGWTRYARQIEEAGAHALELNVYFVAANANETAESVEARYVDIVQAVRDVVRIPIAVKLSPFFTALPAVARRIAAAGADGLVLFNRFMQPEIDLESLTVVPTVRLSTPAELALPIRWIAILRGCGVDVSLAATSGVHEPADVLKALLAGADVAMMASALLIHGPEHVQGVVRGVEDWMRERHYDAVRQMVGSLSHATSPDPAAFERSNYLKALVSYSGAAGAPWSG
ncbi:MAG: dihydroorotate dehydrogenase-like protein [Dehalococcoidia bacterium]|nr:dihydroorotate dehydrogenase-like protein [Dehalococcoidia bacterium]